MNTANFSIVKRSKKRIGRGHGSGKVKTSGRGTKGQNARGHMPQGFEGGQLALIKRLPLLRGQGKNHSQKEKAYPVQVSALSSLPASAVVSLATLRKYHMIDPMVTRVKIVGAGGVTQKLIVAVPISKGALRLIEKAGGTKQSA